MWHLLNNMIEERYLQFVNNQLSDLLDEPLRYEQGKI